jgi:hypothetical protein
MLVLWLGFLVHRSPRFAGSFWGGMLGISGAALMLVPLAYMAVKRIGPLKRFVTRRVAMRTLLTWHIYAGILGPILALLHTGHKFVSPLGTALTALMLVVVLSGFVGRYLLSQFSEQIRQKKEMLTQLEVVYQQTAGQLAAEPQQIAMLFPLTGLLSRLGARLAWAHGNVPELPVSARALRISESMADLEYAIKTHETFKRWFSRWLRFHIVISFVLYGLLALHIYSAVYFGLRWFA